MTARQSILSTPVNIAALKSKGAPPQQLADSVFTNFLYYAKRNWSYIASARAGGEDLLAGRATAVPCGGLAKALKMLYEEDLKIPKTDVEYITIPGYVWTKPEYLCFDPKVQGNVRKPGDKNYRNGCIFNEHYYLRCGTKFYDPCLSSTYAIRDACVEDKLIVITRGEFLQTTDKQTMFFFCGDEMVPGWQRGAWMMFPTREIKKHIKKDLLEKATKFSGALKDIVSNVK